MGTHRLRYQGTELTVTVKKSDGRFVVTVDGQEVIVTKKGDGYVVVNGSSAYQGDAAISKSRAFVTLDSQLIEFELAGADAVSSGSDGGQSGEKDKLRAPMPGKIVKILVKIGVAVTTKQALVVIESMKMENQLLSPSDGIVKAVHFKAGDQVDADAVIIELEVDE
ncbi:hypothetical protein JYU19_00995 [bacterium AH-315-J21]|nr:hypothetical protein [bacterium AH-315-J21]